MSYCICVFDVPGQGYVNPSVVSTRARLSFLFKIVCSRNLSSFCVIFSFFNKGTNSKKHKDKEKVLSTLQFKGQL